ncbi:MAG: AI-2E family transporter [Acidobacteria bacterium]|nr:AI-2E family transporter [Acidobacteriota bacterium]
MSAATTSSTQSVAVWIIAVIAALLFIQHAAALFIPIVIALLVAAALEPIVSWMERHGLRRGIAASIVMMVLMGAAAAGVIALRGQAADALEALPEAARRSRELVQTYLGDGQQQVERAAAEWQGDRAQQDRKPSPPQAQGSGGTGDAASVVQQVVQQALAGAGHLTVITLLTFFLLFLGPAFRQHIVEAAGPDREHQRMAAGLMNDVETQVQRFLLVQLVTSIVVALATWPVLALLGLDNALVWAIGAGILNSIPYFGPVMVSGGLFAVAIVQGNSSTEALQMAAAALVITSLEGWLLTPALMGKAEEMNALSVFLGLLLWTWLWGAWGTLLAVPMLAVVKSTADRVESLRPLGKLLAR